MNQDCRHEFGNALLFPCPIMLPQGAEVQVAGFHQVLQGMIIEVQTDSAIPTKDA